jgi:signal transduction histidine kinase
MAERRHTAADPALAASAFDRTLDRRLPRRWLGWRLRLLVVAALIGCLGMLALVRWLAASPALAATLQASPQGTLTLIGSPLPQLDAAAGRTLLAVTGGNGVTVAVDTLALQRSPRWQTDDAQRERQTHQQEALARALASGSATLAFRDGSQITVPTPRRGLAGLGLLFWPLAALALLLYLIGIVVLLARPQPRNALFLVMAWCQAGTLVFIAIASMPGLGLPPGVMANELMARLSFDLFTAATAVNAFALHPRRVPGAAAIGGGAWLAAVGLLALAQADRLANLWWWAQGGMLLLGAVALAVLSWSYRIEPNPFAAVMRRFGAIAAATLLLVTLGTAAAAGQPGMPQTIAAVGSVVWTLFFASLLLLVPFLSRSKQVLREFALLAGISTVATSLDLLFVALFSLGQFTSLTLAVFLSLGVYAGARQWILNHMAGSSVLTTERTFEQLYRVAREVQETPARYPALLTALLRDLFEPLEAVQIDRAVPQTRLIGGGSGLVVPVRTAAGAGSAGEAPEGPLSLVLRFARRGQRLFTAEDARLADRVVEQLRRAVAYDQAVERGRKEERLRIAQDLHDDIGARLLTLMYKAQSPEMEEYVRHTLQDLKTLTRGLAAADHRLSHAAAEWKADLTQRLTAANVHLGWSFETDRDLKLSVVQWSALTRVLRELVSNALYHAQASRVDVTFTLAGPALALSVADDGRGRNPQAWSHGLGLGGVRKRVKLLGGEVRWRENVPRGIVCEVRVPKFAAPR